MMPFQQGFKPPANPLGGANKGGRPKTIKPLFLPINTGAGFKPSFDGVPESVRNAEKAATKAQQLPDELRPMQYERPASSLEPIRRRGISSGGYTRPGQRKIT